MTDEPDAHSDSQRHSDEPQMTDTPGPVPIEGENPGFDDEVDVETIVKTASRCHDALDSMKDWSREAARVLRAEAAEERDFQDAKDLRELASKVETVAERIDRGDRRMARQP